MNEQQLRAEALKIAVQYCRMMGSMRVEQEAERFYKIIVWGFPQTTPQE